MPWPRRQHQVSHTLNSNKVFFNVLNTQAKKCFHQKESLSQADYFRRSEITVYREQIVIGKRKELKINFLPRPVFQLNSDWRTFIPNSFCLKKPTIAKQNYSYMNSPSPRLFFFPPTINKARKAFHNLTFCLINNQEKQFWPVVLLKGNGAIEIAVGKRSRRENPPHSKEPVPNMHKA